MQSTPQGGLRDRQAAHGEAASRARRPSGSKRRGGHCGAPSAGIAGGPFIGSWRPRRTLPALRILEWPSLGLPVDETHTEAGGPSQHGTPPADLGRMSLWQEQAESGRKAGGAGPRLG